MARLGTFRPRPAPAAQVVAARAPAGAQVVGTRHPQPPRRAPAAPRSTTLTPTPR